MSNEEDLSSFDRDGYVVLQGVADEGSCSQMISQLTDALHHGDASAIGNSRGGIVGGRNLIDDWQGWRTIVGLPIIKSFLNARCGSASGLVRVLYFDKPPGQGWSLAMHRDQTIAVEQHCRPATPFSKPTTKAGIVHVEADEVLLRKMLTLRVHLDPMTDENGPLTVVAGSHEPDQDPVRAPRTILCQRGDVFAMRPLLLHGSLPANKETRLHRRVIHLEFAPSVDLPGDYNWHSFHPVDEVAK